MFQAWPYCCQNRHSGLGSAQSGSRISTANARAWRCWPPRRRRHSAAGLDRLKPPRTDAGCPGHEASLSARASSALPASCWRAARRRGRVAQLPVRSRTQQLMDRHHAIKTGIHKHLAKWPCLMVPGPLREQPDITLIGLRSCTQHAQHQRQPSSPFHPCPLPQYVPRCRIRLRPTRS